MDLRRRFANLPKESDVREPDGRGRYGRKPFAGFGSGDAKQRRSGDRPDDDEGTGEASSGALGKDSGEATGRDLRSEPCKAGGNTQAERRHEDVGNPDGTGSVHSAEVVAGADADLRSQVQRVELRISTGAQGTRRRASRTEVRAGGEGLGGGYRYHKVLRPCQSRHPDGPDRQCDPGQTGVGADREISAAGRNGGGGSDSQRGGNAAGRSAFSTAGQHL